MSLGPDTQHNEKNFSKAWCPVQRGWKKCSMTTCKLRQRCPYVLRNIKTPLCPECGAVMALRMAKKGDKAGAQFWGCSTYPKCHATKAV